ncbi:hypothetical protein PG996_015886 [Apiospora saccharicola]|uniref:Uncharacterized protein n=1 Tax=Apiospora saccharicola TaxID=335842 RepID=A0ABR1TMJ9_9PEZI
MKRRLLLPPPLRSNLASTEQCNVVDIGAVATTNLAHYSTVSVTTWSPFRRQGLSDDLLMFSPGPLRLDL